MAGERSTYRPEIDGLRAVAVLCVVVFHAFPAHLGGGFVGVDVFFVISGFLISGMLFDELAAGHFSFAQFYGRRMRRIVPALVVVLLACVAIGSRTLMYDDFQNLGKHVAAGAGFLSNWVFWSEAGYFDVASELKPLLHLWSLGVEEQFYLVWPVVLFAASRVRGGIRIALACIGVASFALSVAIVRDHGAADFYWPMTRFWELLAGAALADAMRSRGRPLLGEYAGAGSCAGLALIAGSSVYLQSDFAFPGAWALAPTLGAALVIAAGRDAWINRVILSSRPAVVVGLISYPLYLWHWPLLAFARLAGLIDVTAPDPIDCAGIIAVSIALAAATYLWIERPMRRIRLPSRTAALGFLCASLAVTAALVYLGRAIRSGEIRFAYQRRNEIVSAANYWGGKSEKAFWGTHSCFRFENEGVDLWKQNHCLAERTPGDPLLFLVGDSFSAYLSQGLRPYLADHRIPLGWFSAGWCTPLSLHDPNPVCAGLNHYVADEVAAQKPDVLVLFAHYDAYGPDKYRYGESGPYDAFVVQRLNELLAAGAKHVVLMGPAPTWHISLPWVLDHEFLSEDQDIPRRTKFQLDDGPFAEDRLFKAMPLDPRITYVSMIDALCNGDGCLTFVGDDLSSGLVNYDYGHLTAAGASYVVSTRLGPLLSSLLGR